MNKNKDDSVSAKTIEHVTIPDKIGELDFGRNRNIQVRWNVENEMKLFWNDRKRFEEKLFVKYLFVGMWRWKSVTSRESIMMIQLN